MTRRLALLGALLAALAPARAGHAQATIGGEWREDVAAFARSLVDAGLTPGMGVAVTQGDRVLYADGFGVADAATGRRADAGTLFYIASSTKALTATAVALLAGRGTLDLEAPAARYVPGLAFRAPLAADPVTLRRLLTMTDGIESGGPVVVRTAYTGDFTPALLVELLNDYGPADDGTAFQYDNLPYNVLGLVLDPADPHGWKDVVAREVLAPLGMTETSARLSEIDPGRLALPHSTAGERGFGRIPLAKADANLHAAGGHFASARDLARFVAAHAGGGRLDGVRIFPEDVIEATHQPHAAQDRTFGPFRRFGWGYGWDLGTWEEKTVIHRFGSFAGYRSHMSFMPESEVGVVVLVNGDGPASPAADLMATYAYDRMLGHPDLEATYAARRTALVAEAATGAVEDAAHLAERAARMAPMPHPLEAYAGTYGNPAFGRLEWRVVAGGLEAWMGVAHARAEVMDAAANRLRVELFGGGSVASFEFPPDGGPAAAIQMNGERFERIEAEPGTTPRP